MTIKLQDLVSEIKLEDKLSPNTKGILNALKGVAAGAGLVTAAVGAITVGFGKMVDITFDWANRMDSVQDIMGGTTEQAAAFNFVLDKSGTDVNTFTQGMTILEKGLVAADGSLDTTGKKLSEFGINVLDANGKVKDQAGLISEISNKYNQFGTQQERVNFLTEVFGKSGANLIDVFDTLAAEGGLDAVTQKVKDLGLVIDPDKYEEFQRNLNEIKLGGQALAIIVIDKLMPALEDFSDWWVNDGLPMLIGMIDWVDKNAVRWENIRNTWNDHVAPVLNQLWRLFENINGVMERLSPGTENLAGKFTLLGAVQRIAVGWATLVNGVLWEIERSLNAVNWALEKGIELWDNFKRAIKAVQNISIPLPSISGNSGRATGGPVLAGVGYNTVELNRPETFTPFTAGRIDPAKPQKVVATIDEFLLARLIGTELAKVAG